MNNVARLGLCGLVFVLGCSRAAEERAAQSESLAHVARAEAEALRAELDALRSTVAKRGPVDTQPVARKISPFPLLESWGYPGAEDGDSMCALPEMNPAVAQTLTTDAYEKVWNFYAAKCGCPAKFDARSEQRFAKADADGAYAVVSELGQVVEDRPLRDEHAQFTRVMPGYVMTIHLRQRWRDDGEFVGTQIWHVCTLR